jgi:multicomponent Na+:H+ antiporter subunit D
VPESTLAVVVPMLMIFGAIATIALGLVRRTWAWPTMMTTLAVAVVAALALLREVLAVGRVRHTVGGWQAPIGIEFVVDGLSAFMLVTITVIAFSVALYSREAVPRETPGREVAFYGMMMILLLGLCGMVLTGDLFNLYVFIEISALSGYALVSIGDARAAVSAFRYVILGTLGASFYLLGVGFLYLLTGSLNMADVARLLPAIADNPVVVVSLAMMVGGLGLKMALFPLHFWLPDAYTTASSTATALVAPVMTKVSAYVILRMLFFVYGAELSERLGANAVIGWLSAAGIVVASLMAMAQTDVKRMLAYSSVAQLGYIGVGIGLATPRALVGAMLHVLNHATMKCCLFLVTGSVDMQTGRRRVAEWAGLGRVMPWTCAAFTIAALAMVGLPPTNGFFSKWYIVLGSVEAGAGVLGVVVVASSLLTAGYMFRLIERMWAAPAPVDAGEPALLTRLPALALGVAIVALGLGNVWFVTHVLRPSLPVGL